MLMRAGYLIAPAQIEVHDDPIPVPGPGDVVVRVRAALTDGTDLKAYRRGHPQMPMPTRFGHEFSGEVAAIGPEVTRFAVGDAIMSVHSAPCGSCWWCSHDEEELCAHVMETKILGAYAEYLLLPAHIVARNAFRKPPELTYTAAAFLEPLACVVHSVRWLRARADAQVAVIGDGGFGIFHALVLRASGFPDPVIVGRRGTRLTVARSYGLATIDAAGLETDDIVELLHERTGGRGMDAVIECTGTANVWEAAPAFVRRGGTVSLFGGLPGGTRVQFESSRLHYDEVRVVSPFHFGTAAVREAFDLLANGRIEPLPLVSATFALADLGEAFARLDGGDGLKFAIVP